MAEGLRRYLLLLGFLGAMYFIMFSFDQWDMLQKEKRERMQQLQNLRKHLIKDICNGDKKAFSKGKTRIEDLSNSELKNLVVDDTHGIIYCYIPKVACTNWKRIMFSLKHREPYRDPMSIDADLVHSPKTFTLLNSFSKKEIKVKLKHYTKFLFVRDPFVRLISAFRDKFLKFNDYFYQNFGRVILRLYANQSDPDKALESGMHPSFDNFIQYLLDPLTEKKEPFEPHWRQMYRLCHPCLIEYDFVGHQETLQEDAELLLMILKLQNDIKFPPSYENMTSSSSVLDWFRTVPPEDRKKLYELYEKDFKLFGYRRPHELLDG